MSQPVKTKSSSPASGTNSFTLGERPSVRFPRRTVPICVSEPIGLARPLRMASTPATKVVATAPMPGIITPSFPFAGSMVPLCVRLRSRIARCCVRAASFISRPARSAWARAVSRCSCSRAAGAVENCLRWRRPSASHQSAMKTPGRFLIHLAAFLSLVAVASHRHHSSRAIVS